MDGVTSPTSPLISPPDEHWYCSSTRTAVGVSILAVPVTATLFIAPLHPFTLPLPPPPATTLFKLFKPHPLVASPPLLTLSTLLMLVPPVFPPPRGLNSSPESPKQPDNAQQAKEAVAIPATRLAATRRMPLSILARASPTTACSDEALLLFRDWPALSQSSCRANWSEVERRGAAGSTKAASMRPISALGVNALSRR